ncbi:beta,beta-carotene 9',10'-dioxygenase [Karstenula rhodostoma CBS 690.94]|uniref:Beta,beta-carotene 9',10'-dioxygenase n=1 Tax=Karstenula rhodostoma CBS 690.94 TaxID=1392251 RepID=A0A9P4PEI5_9PLEO|nr:beta,beta-carotene 9',10'-dioxygenase [Karstenula rhodostoma CBS 690.94]
MESWPNDAGFDTDYEEHNSVELTVKGKIPPYVAGVLYRTGPLGFKAQTYEKKTWAANHWFDGFSCVHRFEISFPEDSSAPRVCYNSRRTVDELLDAVRKTGKLDGITFGKQRDLCESFFHKVISMFKPAAGPQNVGVTVSINMPGGQKGAQAINEHSNRVETLHLKTDASIINQVDPETLEPKGVCRQKSLHPSLSGELSAAHAETDPVTGDIFNYNLELGPKATYRVFRTLFSTGKTDILATFNGKPAYLHSFFLTKHYVILCVWNSHISWGGLSILYHKNILDAIAPFDPSSKAKWYVVGRAGEGLVATYESDPFFCFHTINAWEQPSSSDAKKTDVVCELSLYENLDVVHRFYYDNLMSTHEASKAYAGQKRNSCLARHAQFRLPVVEPRNASSKPLPAEVLFKSDPMIAQELPTINPSYATRKHRYTYGVADRLKSTFFDGIVKFDNVTQKAIFWDTEVHTPGEPIFVADPEGVEEDDGVLLSVVLDGVEKKSYLLVLRAKNLLELGRAEMKGPMAFGFHGTYKALGRN